MGTRVKKLITSYKKLRTNRSHPEEVVGGWAWLEVSGRGWASTAPAVAMSTGFYYSDQQDPYYTPSSAIEQTGIVCIYINIIDIH